MEKMKEIKFRIFDKKEKKFLIKNQRLGRGDINGLFCVIIDLEEYSLQFDNPDEDRYIFIQYTGIKDKNGREIYEGDIVKPIHTGILIPPEQLEKLEKFIGIVKYDYRQFILVQKTKTKRETEELEIESEEINEIRLFSDVYDLEVVGNIYENNDLFGDDEE